MQICVAIKLDQLLQRVATVQREGVREGVTFHTMQVCYYSLLISLPYYFELVN